MIRSLHTFFALPARRRRLLLEAALLVASARLALWLLPFRAIAPLANRLARSTARSGEGATAEQIGWATALAAAYVPRATCLTQALAAQALLRRHGYPAELRIGVARGERGQLEAHAWVESAGTIVVGGSQQGLAHYQVLPNLVGERL